MKKPRLLIIDDERHTRDGLKQALTPKYEVVTAQNAERGLDLIFERSFDLVLTDLRMPGLDGIGFVRRVKTMEKPPVCILITAYGSIQNAVEALQAGADDYVTKPIKDLDEIELVIERNLEKNRLQEENRELKRELASKYAFEKIIGRSARMQGILDTVRQLAPARSTVLLTGESGTGKELAARAIHQLSNRADKPFMTVHCAALPENLLQSELFGHERGAYTSATERRLGRFETADGGTVFLDEIGEISPAAQVTLLRFLETRTFDRLGGSEPIEVDVRLIAATNRDLKAEVDAGNFRLDLYYRLNVLSIHMPALHEHAEDIPLLLSHYLDISNQENDKDLDGFTPDALNALTAYEWPGNVRELRNCVERLVVMARGRTITVKDVPDDIRGAAPRVNPPGAAGSSPTLDIDENEKALVLKALEACNGNRSAAARKLGISRRTLHRKINQYGLRES